MEIQFPYGKSHLTVDIPSPQGVLVSGMEEYIPPVDAQELVERALREPIGTAPLHELAVGKQKVVLIASDHTRPVPSKYIVPPMLREIRRGNPDAEITILIATGCHRGTKKEELVDKFGAKFVEEETIIIHDCDQSPMEDIGVLPSGSRCVVNKLVTEADLVVSEGFIEPHFFAGFSGGRKSVLPGVASRATVMANHCAEFIAHPKARTGILEGNPIHADMVWAARQAKLAFIVNVVINGAKEPIYAVVGDMEQAHARGCQFLSGLCKAKAKPADIVVTTNGGYPLDQNIYQAVKGMTAAEATVKPGGVIVMLAKSNDGHGGEGFYRQLAEEPDIQKTMAQFLARGRSETEPDQWQTQIFLRVLQRARVVYVSDAPDEMVAAMHMVPAHSLEEALEKARALTQKEEPTITAIPDGVAVMVIE